MKLFFGKAATLLCTATLSWMLLSFYFFPLSFSGAFASTAVFFRDSLAHMAPIKLLITLVFVLFALFVYDLRLQKKQKQKNQKRD